MPECFEHVQKIRLFSFVCDRVTAYTHARRKNVRSAINVIIWFYNLTQDLSQQTHRTIMLSCLLGRTNQKPKKGGNPVSSKPDNQ